MVEMRELYQHMDPSEFNPPETILPDAKLCARCGGFTNRIEEVSLMNRGRPIRSWFICDECRRHLRISDLLDLVEKELNEKK